MNERMIILTFFIDALSWEIIKDKKFLSTITEEKLPLRTALGYSCAAQPSILTGKMPAEHRHWAMYYRTTHNSPFTWLKVFEVLPSWLKYRHRFRRIIYKIHRRLAGFTGYYNLYQIPFRLFKYFDICEKRDIFAPGAFDNCLSIFDHFERQGIIYKAWSWKTPTEQNFKQLKQLLSTTTPIQVYFFYSSLMDAWLHRYVQNGDKVQAMLTYFENEITECYKLAEKNHREVKLIVFSDHGMTPIDKTVNMMEMIHGLGLKEEEDYLAFYDSTMFRCWFFNVKARQEITEFLKSQNYGRVLDRDELIKEGIYFPDARYGELIFLLHPGCIILPSFMGHQAPQGMHGFHPDDSYSWGMFQSNFLPAIKMEHIKDIFSLFMKLL